MAQPVFIICWLHSPYLSARIHMSRSSFSSLQRACNPMVDLVEADSQEGTGCLWTVFCLGRRRVEWCRLIKTMLTGICFLFCFLIYLQMENASSAPAFLSTLSEGEDLIFGTLYSFFGKLGRKGSIFAKKKNTKKLFGDSFTLLDEAKTCITLHLPPTQTPF